MEAIASGRARSLGWTLHPRPKVVEVGCQGSFLLDDSEGPYILSHQAMGSGRAFLGIFFFPM